MGRPEYALARFKFTPLLKEGEAFTRRIGRKIISPYQLLLFISDLLTVNFAFLCGLMITGYAAFLWESTLRNTNAAILCLTVIAFFPAYHLYSYHHLFLRGQHFVNLCKSFFWGFLALGLVVGIYSYPEFLKGSRGIYVVIVGAFALLILSRFYRDYLIYVLSAVGVAFMAVGALGLINAGEKPLLLSQWPSLLVCGLLAFGFASVSR
jgi:FlaA1/EpsC-like NDP-sugar epimerase